MEILYRPSAAAPRGKKGARQIIAMPVDGISEAAAER